MSLEVLEPGPLTTVQDAFGRRGSRHLGVPVGGAADALNAILANRLAGNPDDAALLEMTLDGATLRFSTSTAVALTGGLEATLDGLPFEAGSARAARAGSLLAVGAGRGARGYVAVAGGIDVPAVLGSRATEPRTGFGGLDGRPLRAGDRLDIGRATGRPMRRVQPVAARRGPIRVTAGPHATSLLERLLGTDFTVSDEADRIGVRLAEPLEGGGEAASMGLPLGAIQVPPDGRPIVMLADRPVTGGYLVPAVVIAADVGRVAQLRPGDALNFASVRIEEARAAWRQAYDELAALEPLDEREDDELRWAGSPG